MDLAAAGEGGNVDFGEGPSAVNQPGVLPIKKTTCLLIFKSSCKKGDHSIKGVFLAASHKASELSDTWRVNKFITL